MRSFLWRGTDPKNIKGGHCLVNWQTCTKPRKWGGLGIKDLEKFNRALWLRWLWHSWDTCERPWNKLLRTTDPTERELFFSSTTVSIGNGRNTPFWEARWLNGMKPKELAPNLFLVARYKKRSVAKELHNFNWIRNCQRIDNPQLVEEFTMLFMVLATVTLSNQADEIKWRWTADGKYTVASAYNCQFNGALIRFPASSLWQVKAEPKCMFFAWLVMHDRVLTADNMMKKNWDCNPTCPLCLALDETTTHLLTKCNYTQAVWNTVADQWNLPLYDEVVTL